MRNVFQNSTTTLIALGCTVVALLFILTNTTLPTHIFGASVIEKPHTNPPPVVENPSAPPANVHKENPHVSHVVEIDEKIQQCEDTLAMCKKKNDKPVLPPFKRVVVIAANENPFYSFYTPLVTWTWKHRIGYDVIAIMTRNVPQLVIDAVKWAGGTPVLTDMTWPSGTGKMMQNVRTIAAAIRERMTDDTIITTGDADMMPLNKTYYAVAENMTNQLYVHGNHPGTLGMNQYPLCYLSMTVKHWREIMEIGDMNLNEALVKMYLDHHAEMPNIYFDQDYFYQQVQKYRAKNPDFKVTLVPWYNEMRLDFRVWRDFNFDSQPSWIDSPTLRPGFVKTNWPRFKEGLLRHILDSETQAYFDKFKDDYVREVMKGDDEAKGLRDGFGRESRSVD